MKNSNGRLFLKSFLYAGRGIACCIRQRNMRFHLSAAVLTTAFSLAYGLTAAEYGLLFLTIGVILALEAVNTALEALTDLVSPDYISVMNQAFDAGYLVCTGYRNSKNFDSSWVSAAYALWFMREAKFLNNARMMSGTSCAISGSGWLVSERIVRGMHGWDFHTLTEDIQFSTFCCANNVQIGYAPAEFYDEQPVTFKASWTQRMRWTKGFYEVFFSYGRDLVKGITKRQFASYDMLMTIAPGMILTLLSFAVNATYLIIGSLSHGFIATQTELDMCVGSLIMTFVSMYVVFFILAIITTISERPHIHAKKRWRVFTNIFTFPLFMMTYIPITVAALFKKVEWVPTKHDIAIDVKDVVGSDA